MQKRNNIFINTIKENYAILLLLVFFTVIISIQGCAPIPIGIDIGQISGNCCKIKNPALVTQACIATSLNTEQCAAIAAQSGSSYELVPASSCIGYERNPDCGTDVDSDGIIEADEPNKIGCYLNDGSGVNKFIPQANPPETESLFCSYGTTSLYKCDQGQAILQQNCAPNYCISGSCATACTPVCLPGQTISNCNTLCCGPQNKLTMHFEELADSFDVGTTIDSGKWNIFVGSLSEITQITGDNGAGALRMYKGSSGSGVNQGYIDSVNNFYLRGDFSVQFEYNLADFPDPGTNAGNQLQLEVSNGTTTWILSRQKGWNTRNGFSTWRTDLNNGAGVYGVLIVMFQAVYLKAVN